MKQLDFWRDQKAKQDKLLNKPNLSFNKEESAENKIFYLDIELTEIILKEFPKEYNIEISDILLTALTIANSKINGSRKLNITLEGHGREDIFERVDLSRSVGWFTTLYPIVIDLAENISVVDCLKDVKKQLRSVPQNGIGYGVLKYNTNNKFIGDLPHLAEISFNYLGQFIVGNNTDSTFKFVSDFNSLERAKGNSRPFEMDIVASVVNGKLNTRFIYDKNQYSEDEIEKLGKIYIEEVKKIINESSGNLGKYAPSDFQDVSLDDEDFDNILEELD